MKIESKYEIGQHIWFVYENRGEICLFDDYIKEIVVDNKGLLYLTSEAIEEVKEEDIVLYEDSERLLAKISEIMNKIRENEGKK